MRPTIATAAGSIWEMDLARAAQETGLVRVVGRCTDPAAVVPLIDHVDALVVEAETPWLAEVDLPSIAQRTLVVGVAADEPGARRLRRNGVSEIVSAATRPSVVMALIAASTTPPVGRIVHVTGPRGAPGRSEVALALATALSQANIVALVERDAEAPSLGLRVGLPPGIERRHPPTGPSIVPSIPHDAVGTADLARVAADHDMTVVDEGPWQPGSPTRPEAVVVGEATPTGLLRLGLLCARWDGPVPALVVNRWHPEQPMEHIRAATGLEPYAVIPVVDDLTGTTPSPAMVEALVGVLDGAAQSVA